jgi:hypothetical protein
MGKRSRHRDAKSARVRLEELLDKGDTRGAVEAAKLLVREEPGAASESLAVRAYTERIKSLIAEGLGREAAAIAAIVRERFPSHVASLTSLLEDARLAAGELDWILNELRNASEERRAALEERLLPWITDPSVIVRSSALDPSDPLARESRIVAEVFEIVTSRIASPEETAPLNDIRRRSPLAPWKLLVRAIDAFYRNEEERVAPNIAAIDARSPAARGGEVLSELTTGKRKAGRSSAVERLIDRISGGRATIAEQIRRIEAAEKNDDRRTLREELRALTKSFDKLSPYALEQARLALLPICGLYFEPEQIGALFRIGENHALMARYAAILMEASGAPFASSLWITLADGFSETKEIEPWQAAEIYLHALSLGGGDDDDEFVCRDPSHGHPVADTPDSAQMIEKIIASNPAPSVLARVAPYLDRLENKELRRVLTAWRKSDPSAPEPLVRLLALAAKEKRYDDAVALIRKGDGMKIIDPEYGKLRLRMLLRKAEQLLATRKRGAADALLAEIARRPEDLRGDAGTYLLALQWAAATPGEAGELLAELARRGVVGEIAVAEVTGDLDMPFALPASHPSPEELLEGVDRGIALLGGVDRLPRHSSWLIDRTKLYLDRATENQLLAIGSAALVCRMVPLGWAVTARGLEIGGPMLHRFLLLRAEGLLAASAELLRTWSVIDAARALAERAHDTRVMERARQLAHGLRYYGDPDEKLSQAEITSIVEYERTSEMPGTRTKKPRKKVTRPPKSKPSEPKSERGLFDP